MTANGWIQIGFFFLAVLLVTVPLGAFMYRVLEGEDHFLRRPLGWLERLVYRLSGVDGQEQSWKAYAGGMLAFSAFTMLVTYAIQRLQHLLPFNPQGMAAVEEGSAFNTAASFTTNTNWQGYVGETTMSYLSQMAGLAWHNFISAAAGIAIAIALARGLTRRGEGTAARNHRQLLGGSHPFHRLHPAAAQLRVRARLRVPGNDPEPRPLPGSHDPGRRQASHRHGAGGLAGSRSSSSGPTAAASSTPTRPIPSRTRTP